MESQRVGHDWCDIMYARIHILAHVFGKHMYLFLLENLLKVEFGGHKAGMCSVLADIPTFFQNVCSNVNSTFNVPTSLSDFSIITYIIFRRLHQLILPFHKCFIFPIQL